VDVNCLRDRLAARCQVEQVAVYAQVDALESNEEIMGALRRGEIEYITRQVRISRAFSWNDWMRRANAELTWGDETRQHQSRDERRSEAARLSDCGRSGTGDL